MELDKDDILRSIALTGVASEENRKENIVIANKNKNFNILDLSSGLVRIKRNLIPKFKLEIGKPFELSALSNLEIRCCLCGEIIKYPAWRLVVKYNVNVFHYLVCFDLNSRDKVSAKCYRK